MNKKRIFALLTLVILVVCFSLSISANVMSTEIGETYKHYNGAISYEGAFTRSTGDSVDYYGSFNVDSTINKGIFDGTYSFDQTQGVYTLDNSILVTIRGEHTYTTQTDNFGNRYVTDITSLRLNQFTPFNEIKFTDYIYCNDNNSVDYNAVTYRLYNGDWQEGDYLLYNVIFSYLGVDGEYHTTFITKVANITDILGVDDGYAEYNLFIGQSELTELFNSFALDDNTRPYRVFDATDSGRYYIQLNDVQIAPYRAQVRGTEYYKGDGYASIVPSNQSAATRPLVEFKGYYGNNNVLSVTDGLGITTLIVFDELYEAYQLKQAINYNMSENLEFSGFLSNVLNGFLTTEFFGVFSFGGILLAIIGIGVFWAVIKIFAGG